MSNARSFSFCFPSIFLNLDNGAVWLSNVAPNLFATKVETLPNQINPLQSPIHFSGFGKTIFGFP